MVQKDLKNPKHPISIARLRYIEDTYLLPISGEAVDDGITELDVVDNISDKFYISSNTFDSNITKELDQHLNAESTLLDVNINISLNVSTDAVYDVVISSEVSNRVIICDPIIYFSAEVIGKKQNHVFEWAEITDTNVPLFITDSTHMYYLNDPSLDRTIRFYIDRGTSKEQYKDFNIYATPTSSIIGNGLSVIPSRFQTFNTDLLVSIYTINSIFDYTIPFNSFGEYITNTASLSWEFPTFFYSSTFDNKLNYQNWLVSTSLELNVNGMWVVIKEALKSEQRIYNGIAINDVVRIASKYKKYGHVENEVYTTDPFPINPTAVANTVLSNVILNDLNLVSSITRIVMSIYNLDVDDYIAYVNSIGSFLNSVSFRNVLSVLYEDSNTDIFDLNLAVSNDIAFSITRSYGTSIGG